MYKEAKKIERRKVRKRKNCKTDYRMLEKKTRSRERITDVA